MYSVKRWVSDMGETSRYDGLTMGEAGNLWLPLLPGTYALVLTASRGLEISVGRLGRLTVQPGCYVYVGSALGPGGLARRVGRHAAAEKKCRWHIDYLTTLATLDEVWYTVDKARRECQWAGVLKQVRGATVPLEGFGTSDCRCRSHLFFFRKRPSPRVFRQQVRHSIGGHGPIRAVRSR
jgi:Uri superfamily endonuclease